VNPNTPIHPTAIYTRPELRLILGRNLADDVCKRSRKIRRGKYLGRHILETLDAISTPSEFATNSLVTPFTIPRKGQQNGDQAGREKWTC